MCRLKVITVMNMLRLGTGPRPPLSVLKVLWWSRVTMDTDELSVRPCMLNLNTVDTKTFSYALYGDDQRIKNHYLEEKKRR